MNGDASVANGVLAGTNGSPLPPLPPWLNGVRAPKLGPIATIFAIGLIMALLNTTSVIIEAVRSGYPLHPREPFVWEFSSLFVIALLAPLVRRAVTHWPFHREVLLRSLIVHAALTLP